MKNNLIFSSRSESQPLIPGAMAILFSLLLLLFLNQASNAQDGQLLSNMDDSDNFSKATTLIENGHSNAEFPINANYNTIEEYISMKLKFPEEERETGRYGEVKVHFEILENGGIGKINILESPGIAFDNSVKHLLRNMPLWKPAYKNAQAVVSTYQLKIDFRLQ